MTLPLVANDPFLGKVILDRYAVHRIVGEGWTGRVYEARDQTNGNEVAIKLLLERYLPRVGREKQQQLFRREARIISDLHDPRTIKLIDFAEHPAGLIMITEFLHGRTLQQAIIDDGPLPPEVVRQIMCDVSHCLSEAHSKGILHRDIKPANLFLQDNGDQPPTTKVLDFGIATLRASNDVTSISTNPHTFTQSVGTLDYISPEQLHPEPNLTGACDLYSLGATAYHALTGSPPFSDYPGHAVTAHLKATPPSFAAKGRRLPPQYARLEHIVKRCLAKAPQGRYPTPAALRLDLEALEESAQRFPETQLRNRQRRSKIMVGGAIVLFTVVAASAAAFLPALPTSSSPICIWHPRPEGFAPLETCADSQVFEIADAGDWRGLARAMGNRAMGRPNYLLNQCLANVKGNRCQLAEATLPTLAPAVGTELSESLYNSVRTQFNRTCRAQLSLEIFPRQAMVHLTADKKERILSSGNDYALPPGRYEVVVSSPGYAPYSAVTHLKKAQRTHLRIALKRRKRPRSTASEKRLFRDSAMSVPFEEAK